MNPSAINKSASAAIRLIIQSPPEGNLPMATISSSFVEICITISSLSTIS